MDTAQTLSPADLLAALPRLRRYARVLVGEREAADVLVEETLAEAWREARARPSGSDLVTWLFARLHAAHRPRPHRAATPAAADVNADDTCARLLRLPVDEREVLLLVAVERLAYGDIATLLDVPVATVLSTLARARARLSAMQSWR